MLFVISVVRGSRLMKESAIAAASERKRLHLPRGCEQLMETDRLGVLKQAGCRLNHLAVFPQAFLSVAPLSTSQSRGWGKKNLSIHKIRNPALVCGQGFVVRGNLQDQPLVGNG